MTCGENRRIPLTVAALCLAAAFMTGASAQVPDATTLSSAQAPPNAVWVDQLDLTRVMQEYGTAHAGRSVDNNPLTLGGIVYPHGIGSHATSQLAIDVNGAATRFVSMVGVDDEKKGAGSVTFQVWVDGKKAIETPVMSGGDRPRFVSVDLTGAKRLILRITDAGDGIDSDHGDWAGAMVVMAPGTSEKPTAVRARPIGVVPIVSGPPPPIIFPTPPAPSIHGPRVVGATPGRPFLFLIPATGQGPLTYAADSLPTGLQLDSSTGIITGALQSSGVFHVQIGVSGPDGADHRELTVVAGPRRLALTPPMGWNSWNVWAGAVSDEKVRQAADWMVKSGLAAHGFQYINIDDTWEGPRDPQGNITTNAKFPDMKALADYVHSKGLKLGIYSGPGPTTCGGYPASYQHEQQDADSYAKWGIDYLKYDWCSYGGIAKGNGLSELQEPYAVMREALDNTNRDIVYSFCQYGMGDVWTWGTQIGGNCWRTTGDINDSWRSLNGIAFSQNGHEVYASPGHWNDPDMLVVGLVGWGNPHPSHLTPNEQLLHISMWCLQSAPLLIGCDMTKLDPFTTALLSNDEVLAIDQDPLGRPAGMVHEEREGQLQVWSRPLFDGTLAVGLFNRLPQPATVTARWSDLGIG
ncbi:MAG: NPCBM/NEW2 domain-containing protein, partial [Chloroflexi bacterium]|nr:NPCBM/NEW2 domain-containing protein [Chloroflexota bacterium]